LWQSTKSKVINKGNQTMLTIENQTIVLSANIPAMIDEAGSLRFEIERLTVQLDNLKTAIKATGAGKHLGAVFYANVTDSNPKPKTDWKTVALRCNPSTQLVTAHTSMPESVRAIAFDKLTK
jgi:hypothetical protein